MFYLFALLCSMSLFTACSDDDDAVDYSKVIEEEIAGNYKGTLTVTVEGETFPAEPQKINIEKASPSAINLSLSDFSFVGINIGNVELENCVLSQNGDTYTFTGTQKLTVDVLSCTINAKGTITKGTVKIEMDIDATLNGDDQNVKVVYEGTRLTGSESSEAKITAFSFDLSNEANAIVIEQPVINDDNTITFRVNGEAVEADANVLKNLVPTFTISDKATASVKSGEAMDLSQDVTITVTAEDGTVAEYFVKAPTRNALMKFTFDEWGDVSGNSEGLVNTKNYSWASPEPHDILASANEGVAALRTFFGGSYSGEYAMLKEDEGYKGSAVKLQTLRTKGVSAFAPAITPASLFTGTFKFALKLDAAEQLKMTQFGVVYEKKPLLFKGYYKYTKGSNYIDGSQTDAPENQPTDDKGTIIAVLYEAVDDEGNDYVLDGATLKNSPYIVLKALVGGEDYISDTQGEWAQFEIPFEEVNGKTYDSTKNYKLAIVCQSSKDGEQFKGAEGSTLIVDELEVIGE